MIVDGKEVDGKEIMGREKEVLVPGKEVGSKIVLIVVENKQPVADCLFDSLITVCSSADACVRQAHFFCRHAGYVICSCKTCRESSRLHFDLTTPLYNILRAKESSKSRHY